MGGGSQVRIAMQAKIVIERHVLAGSEARALDILVEMRAMATRQTGYISGETLVDVGDNSTMIVVSTWRSIQDWKRWEGHSDRILLEDMLNPMMVSSPVVHICADAGEMRLESEGASSQLLV